MRLIQSTEHNLSSPHGKNMLLAHPFRLFFLAAGLYAMLTVFAWLAFLFGGWPLPIGWAPMQWHSHEMLYGFVVAAIAGFMLTAMTNWTGATPLRNKGLLALFLVWLAGRVSMLFAAWFSPWLVASIDLAFISVLAVYVFLVLWRFQNRRNLVLVVVLAFMWSGNLVMHAGYISGRMDLLQRGQLMGFDLITVLIAIIGGRIIPAFSGNWLRNQGRDSSAIRTWSGVETSALISLVLVFLADAMGLPTRIVAGLALLAASIHTIRLYGWAGWLTLREPLLWILHLAYLWLVVALYLRGLSPFVDAISNSVWQHAMGVGAIGTIIPGVMTRVAMGHTGRPLKLINWGIIIYVSITVAAILRVFTALGLFDFRLGVSFSAVCWVIAFGLFVLLYGPILASPRADGKPG